LKEESRGGNLLQNMPVEFQEFENHIFSLDFVDEPGYNYLVGILNSAAARTGHNLNLPFEWEAELI
jgi:hypothetical protein